MQNSGTMVVAVGAGDVRDDLNLLGV